MQIVELIPQEPIVLLDRIVSLEHSYRDHAEPGTPLRSPWVVQQNADQGGAHQTESLPRYLEPAEHR